jgi:hypothetical protein
MELVDPTHRDADDATGMVRGLKARHLQLIGKCRSSVLELVLTGSNWCHRRNWTLHRFGKGSLICWASRGPRRVLSVLLGHLG